MSNVLIVPPLPMTVTASRGTGAANLATRDPKEVWADSAAGGSAIYVDLGVATTIDTVFLGYLRPPAAGARWAIVGGLAGYGEFGLLDDELRVPDVAGQFAVTSHGLANIAPVSVRYLTINLAQPGAVPLTAGALVVGKAFNAALGREWGFGRQPIDTGTATALPSGGFAVVDGARKVKATWTYGDLTEAEADQMEATIALTAGETGPVLVVEDAARRAGLRARLHYGLLKWRAFERRNRAQTKWDMEVEQWV